jgi:hypothetical protein
MKLFVPITKVDVEKREVFGRAVQEVPDQSREIFDYASSVPHFKGWSSSFEKATESLPEPSLGNIRAMHGKVAAGKVIAIDFNDAEKAIDIGTKIVDDAEWQKCVEGVYTGFSIGGSYVKKWKDADDPTLTRYTAGPSEISLVDNPCVPTARFAMVKADGVTEATPFQRLGVLKAAIGREALTVGELITLAQEYLPAASLAKSEATVKDIHDELRALLTETPVIEAANTPALEKREPAPESAAAAANVAPAAPMEISTPAKPCVHLRKGLYSVESFAGIIQSLAWLAMDAQSEQGWEQDASTVPADLRTALQLIAEIFKRMAAEEVDELIASIMPDGVIIDVIELARGTDGLVKAASLEVIRQRLLVAGNAAGSSAGNAETVAKAGKRHSTADQDLVQAVHDHAVALGGACPEGSDSTDATKFAPVEDLKKAADALTAAKVAETAALDRSATLEKRLGTLEAERTALAAEVTALKARPAEPKGVLRTVAKSDDATTIGAPDTAEIEPDPTNPLAVMKAVHQAGGRRVTL